MALTRMKEKKLKLSMGFVSNDQMLSMWNRHGRPFASESCDMVSHLSRFETFLCENDLI